jgi:hypothetical protein
VHIEEVRDGRLEPSHPAFDPRYDMGPGNAAFECSQHEELNIYIQITVESRYPDTEQFVRFGMWDG